MANSENRLPLMNENKAAKALMAGITKKIHQ